jgi:acyl-CoA oxidase
VVQNDPTSTATATRLLKIREARLVAQLQKAMAVSRNETFETWMKRESETVQGTAQAFIEAYVVTECAKALGGVSATLRPIFERILQLDALSRVREQMAWYLLDGLITSSEAAQVRLSLIRM